MQHGAYLTFLTLALFCAPNESIIEKETKQSSANKLNMNHTFELPPILDYIILGSQSTCRIQILKDLNCKSLTIIKPNIDEENLGDRSEGSVECASELVKLLGSLKGKRVLEMIDADENYKQLVQEHHHVIITGDIVAVCNNQILEKPKNKAEFKRFYQMYSNHYLETVGSVVLTDVNTRKQYIKVDVARVTFKTIPNEVIDDILNNKIGSVEENEGLFCSCGGLIIEHSIVSQYIESLSSTSYIEGIDDCIDTIMGIRKQSIIELGLEVESEMKQKK